MEIKFKQGDSVTIPEGCKAVVSDGTVVFEKAKTNFKAGEVITGNTGEILLVRECSGCLFSSFVHIRRDGKLWAAPSCMWYTKYDWRLATEEEKQRLFDKMKEQGLRWNAEEKKVEKIRWRANLGEEYHYIDSRGNVIVDYDLGDIICGERLKFGNYFCTRKQAEKAAEAVRETLRKFHEEND